MPKLNKYIRFALFSSLQLLTLGNVVTKQSDLPPECKDLDLVKGNPLTAKTILFGENHFDVNCYKSMKICTEALTKDISKTNKIALLESLPAQSQTVCSDESDRGLDTIFDECSGWDLPKNQFDKITKPFRSQHAYNELQQQFEGALRLKPNMDNVSFKNFLSRLTDIYTAQLNKEAESQQTKFNQYKKTHPKADQNKFYVTHNNEQTRLKLILKTLKSIASQVQTGVSFKKAIKSEITNKLEDAVVETANELRNPHNFMGERNKALAKSTKKYSQKKDRVVAYVGKFHFKPDPQYDKTVQENQQNIINELFDNLDQYADENPYAILSCK